MIDYLCPHGELQLCTLCTDKVGCIRYEKWSSALWQDGQIEEEQDTESNSNIAADVEGEDTSEEEYIFTCGPTGEEALCDVEDLFTESEKRELVTGYMGAKDETVIEFGRVPYYDDPDTARRTALQDGLFERLREKLLQSLGSNRPEFFMLFIDAEESGRSWAREFLEADAEQIRATAWRSAYELGFYTD